jgi:hypothetical protein
VVQLYDGACQGEADAKAALRAAGSLATLHEHAEDAGNELRIDAASRIPDGKRRPGQLIGVFVVVLVRRLATQR